MIHGESSAVPQLLTSEARQRRAVEVISNLAGDWLSSRQSPDEEFEVFPNAMVWESLEPLLVSLSAASSWSLIDKEQVRGATGPKVIGHIVASNTPLLPIVSVIRALFVGSNSLVKLPANGMFGWYRTFIDSLRCKDSDLGRMIETESWSRDDLAKRRSFYERVSLVVAYGSNETLSEIREECPVRVIEYGHKISAAILTTGAGSTEVYDGLAKDILMYDQGGCLSPHTVFVEGSVDEARSCGEKLAAALKSSTLPAVKDTPGRAAKIAEYRSLITMDKDTELLSDGDSRHTVVLHKQCKLLASPTHAIICVVPGAKEGIIDVLSKAKTKVQGISLAAKDDVQRTFWTNSLTFGGISYICRPGTLQQPTIHWREDDRDVLACLVN